MIIGVYVLVLQNQAVFRLMFPNALSLLWNTLVRSFDRLFIFFWTYWSLEVQFLCSELELNVRDRHLWYYTIVQCK